MKIIVRLLVLTLLLTSVSAFADPTVTNDAPVSHYLPQLFTVPQTDESLALLGMLFGGMGDVLPGAPNVMGVMFAKFNSAMLLLGTLVLLYTFIFGLIGTAHEGEFLGKKFNSIWTPIRVILGILTLLPLKSGYCFLQIILMWVVIQGIGAADTVWAQAVKYIKVHGVYNTQNFQHENSNAKSGTYSYLLYQGKNATQSIFKSYVCMYQTYQGNKQYLDIPQPQIQGDKLIYNFPTYQADGTTVKNLNACGSVTMPYYSGDVSADPQKVADKAAADAMSDVLGVLNNAAQEYTQCSPDNPDPTTCVEGQPLAAADKYFADHISAAVDLWMREHVVAAGSTDGLALKQLNRGENLGWIYAGAFYRQLALMTPQMIQTNAFSDFNLAGPQPQYTSGYSAPNDAIIQTLSESASSNALNKKESEGNTDIQIKVRWLSEQGGASGALGDLTHPINTAVVAMVELFTTFLKQYNAQTSLISFQSGTDPLMGLQTLGTQMMDIVGDTFIAAFMLAAISTIVAGIFISTSGIGTVLMKIIGWLAVVFTCFYAVGLIMASYIQLIPYLVFFFSALGWMIAVVETMLAAPRVALGIVYPEGGHELLGRAAPAAMLVTNVFIRPTLMIFGLIVGMILSYVGLTLLNSAYEFVIYSSALTSASMTRDSMPYVNPFVWIMYMMIYVSIVMILVNKCYALIHKLPDQILRWIGGQHTFAEYGGGAEEVGQKAQAGSEKTGQLVGEAHKGATDELQKAMPGGGGGGSGSGSGENVPPLV